jgi:energy-coupling factor transporter ATP-binding protein EcfA2
MSSKIESINDHFKLPIFYNKDKIELKEEIVNDLELVKTIDPSCNPIYHHAFEPQSEFSEKIIQQMQTYYTTDTNFLEDSQKLLSSYTKLDELNKDYTDILEVWNEIKNDNGFKQKYYYLDWSFCEFLNKSEQFLQFMSLYSLASPVLSFLIPVFILIVPFFIVKMKGIDVTLSEYIEVLKVLAANHALGRIFTHFNKVPMDQKIYIAVSAIFYLISIYQNVVTCYKFNQNMKNIHKYLNCVKEYSNKTIFSMNYFLQFSSDLKTYSEFNESIKINRDILSEYVDKISKISDYKFSFQKISEIGYILKCFYELYDDKTYNSAFLFSFGFNGYVDNIENLIQKIENKQINPTTFEKGSSKTTSKTKKSKTIFKNSYYAALIKNNPVKNDIKLDKNIVITGPNASGKTTILKSTLINVIFSQQFGCGFYDSAKLVPYKYLHSYLNIPDTSGRDSLFQAEARRCKEIIDIIQENPNETHLCSFDELYSGTNPDEAVISSLAFMEYLVKFKNVGCLLTTHFIKVCKKLQKNKNIVNYHMETIKGTDAFDFKYTYSMKKGISEVRGGIKVLTDMNYPKEILDNTQKMKA